MQCWIVMNRTQNRFSLLDDDFVESSMNTHDSPDTHDAPDTQPESTQAQTVSTQASATTRRKPNGKPNPYTKRRIRAPANYHTTRSNPNGKPNTYTKRLIRAPANYRTNQKALTFAVSELVMPSKSFESEITSRPHLLINGRKTNGWVLSLRDLRKYCIMKGFSNKPTKEQIAKVNSQLKSDTFELDGCTYSRRELYTDPGFARALKTAYNKLSSAFTGLHLRTDGKLSVKFFFGGSVDTASQKTEAELFEEQFIACKSKESQDALKPPHDFSADRMDYLRKMFGVRVPVTVEPAGLEIIKSKKNVEDSDYLF